MKINMLQPILDIDGTPLKDEKKEDLTLRTVLRIAINTTGKDETIGAEKKTKIFQLGLHIFEANDVELTVDQRGLLKERVDLSFNSVVYGRVCGILEVEKAKAE